MDEKERLTEKFLMVNMNEIEISTRDKHIIGTQGLAYCIGFVLYNKKHGRAIVGHISPDQIILEQNMEDFRIEIFNIIYQNNLMDSPFDLKIIEGKYKSNYMTNVYQSGIIKNPSKMFYTPLEILEENLKKISSMQIGSIEKGNFEENAIQTLDDSKCFAFDASSGEFVTDKVFFGKEYYEINHKNSNEK